MKFRLWFSVGSVLFLKFEFQFFFFSIESIGTYDLFFFFFKSSSMEKNGFLIKFWSIFYTIFPAIFRVDFNCEVQIKGSVVPYIRIGRKSQPFRVSSIFYRMFWIHFKLMSLEPLIFRIHQSKWCFLCYNLRFLSFFFVCWYETTLALHAVLYFLIHTNS